MPIRTPLDLYQERLSALDRRRLLRPMSGGEIIDQATRIMQLHGLPLLAATLFPVSLCFLALVFFFSFIGNTLSGTHQVGFWNETGEVIFATVACLITAAPLFTIGASFSTGLTTRLTSQYMLGQDPDFKSAVKMTYLDLPRMASVLGVVLLRTFGAALLAVGAIVGMAMFTREFPDNLAVSFIVVIGIMVASMSGLIIPPILLGNLSLAPSIAAVEGLSGKEAAKRSRHLMRQQGHVSSGYSVLISGWFLVGFVGFVLLIGLYFAYGLLNLDSISRTATLYGNLGAVVSGAIDSIPIFLTVWVVLPFYSAILSVLYYDRRIRVEAYDIKVLAHDVLQNPHRRPVA